MVLNWLKVGKIIKFIWIAVTLLSFLWIIKEYDGAPHYEGEEFELILMVMLGFPFSYLGAALFSLTTAFLYHRYNIVIKVSYLLLTVEWLILFSLGYFQWFVAIQFLFNKVLKKGKNR